MRRARACGLAALASAALAPHVAAAQLRVTRDSLNALVGARQVFLLDRLLLADPALGDSSRSCFAALADVAFRLADSAAAHVERCATQSSDTALLREGRQRIVEAQQLQSAMRVTARASSRLRIARNQFGMSLLPVSVNGGATELLLDTGAGMSVLTASLADSLDVRYLPEGAMATGAAGARTAGRIALARLDLGNVTIEDVSFVVLPDSALRVRAGPLELQVRGIVGLPVLIALEEFSVAGSGWLQIPEAPTLDGTANLAMDGRRLVVEATVQGRAGVFLLDSGARSTTLYPPARMLLGDVAAAGRPGTMQVGGAGGTRSLTVVRLNTVTIGVGGRTVTLQRVPLLDSPQSPQTAWAAGTIGQDVLGALPLVTFNLRHMILRLGDTGPGTTERR